MKRTPILLGFLLAGLAFTSLAAAADRGVSLTAPEPIPARALGTYHALIVGINAYQEWNPLKTAVKDATALRDVLVNQYGFNEENVILRTDRDATQSRIVHDLRSLASGLTEQDNLLVYFAGHGQVDDLTGDGYWIPVEGKLKDPVSWISHSVLKGVLGSEKVPLKNVVVIADSCYSGTLLRGGPSLLNLEDRAYIDKLTQAASKRSRQVITSGGVEPVADGGRDGHSLFAYYLISALRNNDREVVDLENLFHTRVWEPVTQIGGQRPNVGRLKTPMDEDGQFVLRNQGLVTQKAALAAAGNAQQTGQEETSVRGETERREGLEAEKASLEAERRRLEEERRLLEEKQRLESQKIEQERRQLALEREQQHLAREKAAMEAEKQAAATQTAALPPSSAPGAAQGKKRVALFTFSEVSTHKNAIKKGDSLVCHMLTNMRGIQVTHALLDSPVVDKRGITPLNLSPEETQGLWLNTPGIISRKSPNLEAFVQRGRALNVDLVLVLAAWRIASGDTVLGEFHLIDIAGGRILSSRKIDLSIRSYDDLLARGVKKEIIQYLVGATG